MNAPRLRLSRFIDIDTHPNLVKAIGKKVSKASLPDRIVMLGDLLDRAIRMNAHLPGKRPWLDDGIKQVESLLETLRRMTADPPTREMSESNVNATVNRRLAVLGADLVVAITSFQDEHRQGRHKQKRKEKVLEQIRTGLSRLAARPPSSNV